MNPFEIIKLSKKVAWVGELVEKSSKFVEPEKYKAYVSEILALSDQLRQKIDALIAMIREDGKEMGLLASLPAEDSDVGIA